MEGGQRWVIGLDLLPGSRGPLWVGVWLRSSSPPALCVAAHVVEGGASAEVVGAARARLDGWIAEAGAAGVFDVSEVLAAANPERGLVDAMAAHQATGIVIGRWSRRAETSLVRLGRVARRLLRDLPGPVIVTPPDLEASQLDGPILLATDLAASSTTAARFAVTLAARLGRPLVAVHVEVPVSGVASDVPERDRPVLRAQEERLVRERAEAWAREHLPPGVEVVIEAGGVADRLLAVQAGLRAAMVVVGSRQLSLVARIFGSSLASGLAAVAPSPVAVVPPSRA